MSEFLHKNHHITVLMYHLVFAAMYRRMVFDGQVEAVLKEVCLEIEVRYEVKFLEIGVDGDHVHFLVQSIPSFSVTKIVSLIKSITAREVFKRCPQVKKILWGGALWTAGYFASTTGEQRDLDMVKKYVKNQGNAYQKIYQDYQGCSMPRTFG